MGNARDLKPIEFSKLYGQIAFQNMNVKMVNIRQYLGLQEIPSWAGFEARDAEWVLYTGTAGKTIILNAKTVDPRTIGLPLKPDGNQVVKDLNNCFLTPKELFHSGIIPFKLVARSNIVYCLTAIHDTGLSAYNNNRNYDSKRWTKRFRCLFRWFMMQGKFIDFLRIQRETLQKRLKQM